MLMQRRQHIVIAHQKALAQLLLCYVGGTRHKSNAIYPSHTACTKLLLPLPCLYIVLPGSNHGGTTVRYPTKYAGFLEYGAKKWNDFICWPQPK
jgi:hypothetical protein